jgi:hypothetical protein
MFLYIYRSFYIILQCSNILKYLSNISKYHLKLLFLLFFPNNFLVMLGVIYGWSVEGGGVVIWFTYFFLWVRGCCLNVYCWYQCSLMGFNGRNEMFRILVLLCRYLFYVGLSCWCWWPLVVLLEWFIWGNKSILTGNSCIVCLFFCSFVCVCTCYFSHSVVGSLVVFLFAVFCW